MTSSTASSSSTTHNWELYKENAAPLERGRNTSILCKALSSPTCESTKSKMEHDVHISNFESAIRPSEKFKRYFSKLEEKRKGNSDTNGNSHDGSNSSQIDVESLLVKCKVDKDPIIHWLKYIKYHEETYPSDTHTQFLLMERCMHSLFNIPKYQNDVRFIRVCVLYADKTSNPNDQFKLYHKCKIGEKVAIFWLAWAWVAEKKKDYPFAEKIFRKAIQKEAKPKNKVEERYKQFQRRMSRYWLNNAAQQQQQQQLDQEIIDNEYNDRNGGNGRNGRNGGYNENDENGRGTLSGLTEEGVRQNFRSRGANAHAQGSGSNNIHGNAHGNNSTNIGGIFVTRSGQRSQEQSTGNDNNGVAPKASFSIFMENDPENDHGSGSGDGSGSGYNLNQSTIQDFDENPVPLVPRMVKEKEKKKENTLPAEVWNERGGLHSQQYGAGPGVGIDDESDHEQEQETGSSVARRWAGTGSDSIVAGGTSSLPGFQVFVDEDCEQKDDAASSKNNGASALLESLSSSTSRMKRPASRGRGNERTLRQRMDERTKLREPLGGMMRSSDEGSVRTKREPKHSSLKGSASATSLRKEGISKSNTRQIRCGFNENIMSKGNNGKEICFEERRAKSSYYSLVSSQNNFNLLHQQDEQTYDDDYGNDSCTCMDEASSIEEVDMEEDDEKDVDENVQPLPSQTSSILNMTTVHDRKMSLNVTTLHGTVCDSVAKKSNPRKVLFDVNTSLGNRSIISAANNISTASSVINEDDAVGLHGDKEVTLNTKFAARELSMMFSSPAQNESINKSHLQSSKMMSSDRLLFSVHRNKQNVDDSDDSSTAEINDNVLNVYCDDEEEQSQEKGVFRIFEDIPSDLMKNPSSSSRGLDVYEDSDSDSSGIRSEDKGEGDTASLADIMDLMKVTKDNPSQQNEESRKNEEFAIYCDDDNVTKGTKENNFSVYAGVDNGTVLTEDTAAFGDLSFIPHRDGDTMNLHEKVRQLSISDKGRTKR